jgi:hypothetical protein
MNVFVLSTGRCGSMMFAKACQHITNYSSAHESRRGLVGDTRLDYPANHIEVDNRLSWFLGRLDRRYGDRAAYVHLKRNTTDTARSLARRYGRGIMQAYHTTIAGPFPDAPASPMSVALDYCDTVNSNIELFLRGKPMAMVFRLENAARDFRTFWRAIGAEGDLSAAVAEFDTHYNASRVAQRPSILTRLLRKAGRLAV